MVGRIMKAFPTSQSEQYPQIIEGGMDLRDYFAAKAMQTMNCQNNSNPNTILPNAINAYRWADAMMQARKA